MTGIIDREEDPSAAELRDGLIVLRSMIANWISGGMFGRLEDHFADGDYEAEEGQRISIDDATVTLPTTYDDEGDTRAPREYSTVVIVTSEGEQYYLFSQGQWRRVDELEANDEAPLQSLGVNGLAACVAVSFAEEFGGQVGPGTLMTARNFKTALSYKFGAERPKLAADYF